MSQFTETTRVGYGTRTKNSIGGIFVGIVMAAVSVGVLFWNEGRSVKRYKDLKEGAGAVVSVESNAVDPAMEGKLVHTTGTTETKAPLADGDFGVSEVAIKLFRKAEMFQWVERKETRESNNTGGSSTRTVTYHYERKWVNKLVNSSEFKNPAGHENPSIMRYTSSTEIADDVTLGAFRIPDFLIEKIKGSEDLVIDSLEGAIPEVKNSGKLTGEYVYFGKTPSAPEIGDQRVSFSVVRPGPTSLVAQQLGDTFVSYRAKTGGSLDLLESGILPAEQMFQMAHDRNKMLTWGIRAGGFALLSLAFNLILKPLSVMASVLPFLGRIVGAGTGLIAFLLAGIVWSITVAFAWIFYRPVLGIAILVVTVVLIVFVIRKLKAAGKEGASSAPPGDLPPPMDTPPPLT